MFTSNAISFTSNINDTRLPFHFNRSDNSYRQIVSQMVHDIVCNATQNSHEMPIWLLFLIANEHWIALCLKHSKIFHKENDPFEITMKIHICLLNCKYSEFNNGKLFFSHCANMDLAKQIATLNSVVYDLSLLFTQFARQKIYRIVGFVFHLKCVILHAIIIAEMVTDLSEWQFSEKTSRSSNDHRIWNANFPTTPKSKTTQAI